VNAGRLSDLVLFEKRVTPGLDTWIEDFTVSCEAQRQSETACRFIIRYRRTTDGKEISALSHRIIFDGAIWHIASAVHDRRRTMLTIDCDLTNMIEVTHMQSTEREFIEGVPVITPRD
jgi:hypothetical protein